VYKLKYRTSVKKDLRKIPKSDLKKLLEKVLQLSENPRPLGCRKIAGYEHVYRIRYRVYRVVYEVKDDVLVVIIIKAGHRKDIYDKL
jgi:mRNA interferase RelE/StbE